MNKYLVLILGFSVCSGLLCIAGDGADACAERLRMKTEGNWVVLQPFRYADEVFKKGQELSSPKANWLECEMNLRGDEFAYEPRNIKIINNLRRTALMQGATYPAGKLVMIYLFENNRPGGTDVVCAASAEGVSDGE